DLALDLRRHLTDLPLHGVPNRSLGERWIKWRRRRPFTLPALALLLAFALAGGAVLTGLVRQADRARDALREGQQLLAAGDLGPAAAALRRGLALAEGLPLAGDLPEQLRSQLRFVERAEAAGELHRF